jgi:endonuclease/exonuclease/phosphatase family metal-dependent hydrolase
MLCELIENSQENTILVGDFNLPEIDWARKTSGNRGKKFLEATINANYEQLVTFPTHNRGNTLDLVLSNCPARIQSVEEAGKLGNSDHVANRNKSRNECRTDCNQEKVQTVEKGKL